MDAELNMIVQFLLDSSHTIPLVILAVGLSPALVGDHTPNIKRLAARGGLRPLKTVTPAVTCTAQSTLVTGLLPSGHGAVANGWYFRDLSEVWFWRQSNHLIAGEKVWEAGRRRDAGAPRQRIAVARQDLRRSDQHDNARKADREPRAPAIGAADRRDGRGLLHRMR